MHYSLPWLLAETNQQQRLKYLLFWGHKASPDGAVTKSCFSQWWPAAFTVAGDTYATAEHWMMAEKARLFHDTDVLAQILAAKSPAEAKKLGRKIRGFDAAAWDAQKSEIVRTGNLHKFSQHPDLAAFLLATGERVLVEASPVDAIWGIGLAADHADAENPASWRGENLLGFALMEVRDELLAMAPTGK
ncbi:MAG: NADAR family protein [Janthinobacterium lividum]